MTLKAKIKDLKSKIEALVIAIPREQEAYEFYTELKDLYDDKASKEMFEYLARQELQHRINLENILNGLEAQLKEIQKSGNKEE
ncbi:MAG: rubrerythrin [Nitrospinae bacterium]|nr:rubrerythrin [Nitrospinota bacterium]